jgi:RNA polymerase-binding transcription factor DksA
MRMRAMAQDAITTERDTDGIPTSSYDREEALNGMLHNRLSDIDGALERIDAGTYGVCSSCSGDIPPRRLEVLPFATLCVGCKAVADKQGARRAYR